MKRFLALGFAGTLALTATGCFRVSPETRALRDAALNNGLSGAQEKIEFGVGLFTASAARFGSRFIDLPPEARTVINSVHGAEVSIYELSDRLESAFVVLADADRAMAKFGCYRLTGVLQRGQLVAVYVPHSMKSPANVRFSVMVLNERQLVCATARGNLGDILDLAFEKARKNFPEHVASAPQPLRAERVGIEPTPARAADRQQF